MKEIPENVYEREKQKIYRAYCPVEPCPKCGYPKRPGWMCTYCKDKGE